MIDRRTFIDAIGRTATLAATAAASACRASDRQPTVAVDVSEVSISELQTGLAAGRYTSQSVCEAYLDRITRLDRSGPTLRSVLETNPRCLEDAAQLDTERSDRRPRGPLHGVPILVKGNIDALNPDGGSQYLQTTGGSLALLNVATPRDAFLVARLREAGVIILGTANLSEWANSRSSLASNGWSALGGQTVNPYALDRSPTGSSSGSAVAVAASLCAAAIGTETLGSIQTPSSLAGLVSVKPTTGLVSRSGIIPISSTLDTAGPMARNVSDAAAVLTALAATADPEDTTTLDPGAPRSFDYTTALDKDGLRNVRIGLSYLDVDRYKGLRELLQRAETVLLDLGAVVQRVHYEIDAALWPMLDTITSVELKLGMGDYLRTRRPKSPYQSLADLMAFNRRRADAEMRWFGQDNWELADKTTSGPAYDAARLGMRDLIRRRTLDPLFTDNKLDAIVGLAFPLPWKLDPLQPDFNLEWSNVAVSSAAGYPSVTVPMGDVRGLPVGMVVFGRMWSEAALLRYAFAYEQATRHRKAPTYPLSVDPPDFRPIRSG